MSGTPVIEGALHIPQDYIFDRIGELDRATAVVTVCRSGSRSAAQALLRSRPAYISLAASPPAARRMAEPSTAPHQPVPTPG